MRVNEQETNYSELWTTLCADEQYSGLCEFLVGKMSDLKDGFSEFRDYVPEAQRDDFDRLLASICHPPPGCR